ncbi:MAG: transcription-repair coupling factor [Acidobacteriota bacterium]
MSLEIISNKKEFKDLGKALAANEEGISITGVAEPAKPYFLAALVRETKKPVFFIKSIASDIFRWKKHLQFYLSVLVPSIKAHSLPQLTDNPYLDYWPPLDSVATRMKYLLALIHQQPRLTLSNLPGLLKFIPSAQELPELFLSLEAGSARDRDKLLHRLQEFGYSPEDVVNSPGELAWRGGVVDVFSPWQSYPFRLEFSGDEILSLREFNTSSQRSVQRLQRIVIPSLREYPSSRKFFDSWQRRFSQSFSPFSFDEKERLIKSLKDKSDFPGFLHLSLLNREKFCSLTEYFKDPLWVIDDFEAVEKEWKELLQDFKKQGRELRDQKQFVLEPEKIFDLNAWEEIKRKAVRLEDISSSGKRTISFSFQSLPRFSNRIPFFLDFLKKRQQEGTRCLIFLSGSYLREKVEALLKDHGINCRLSDNPFVYPADESVVLLIGRLRRGFADPGEKLFIFAEEDFLTEAREVPRIPRSKPFISHFQDLREGDYVVHNDYGIGKFQGLVKMDYDGKSQDFMELLYRDGDKLFVPVEDLYLVQKYTQVGSFLPPLNKLGTASWDKVKSRTKKAIEEIATELLRLYAQRKALKGFAFSPAGNWERDFEKAFQYRETEDQMKSIQEILADMENDSPMDRLLCGDVGYGKTEVAMRACFKAVMDGKQVAVLCPTTVLASQHLETFRNRMTLFPIRIEALTRLQTPAQQKRIVADLKKGLVDIVIGTHRLLSGDVGFKEVGLLIIDEEQRFGVKHKEKLKQMKANIDVLTMTATPIPRTLNLSFSGLSDISLIETAPRDRLAVHTVVTPFSKSLITKAVSRELVRNGQVYFIHNRIEDIDNLAEKIRNWVPRAKVVVLHGRMSAATLERRMIDFIQQKYNVLISTTIIENGIDIPLVNTLIVNRADRFGLAQLYQLRGRVGRSSRQAYAYFLIPALSGLSFAAKERLKALKEFSALGSGFRLAAKDLEIRGAGNFLGSQQHGYMESVGFDFYMKLLEETVRDLKEEKIEQVKSRINLKINVRIPENYLPQINLRLNLYKRVSSAESLEEISRIKDEVRDRYGPLPEEVNSLLEYGKIKHLAGKASVESLDRAGSKLVIKFHRGASSLVPSLIQVMKKYKGNLTPQGVMTLRLPVLREKQILAETISILKEFISVYYNEQN